MYGYNRRKWYGGSSRNAESSATGKSMAVIDGAVAKAHSDVLTADETVSAWSVSKSALVILKAASLESLGFYMQNVPTLNRIMLTEAKVNSFIHCFVGVQKITSLYDLEMAICESEGLKSFEELELGPILKHPLVVHYFSIGPEVTEICKITSEQIVAYLSILPRVKRKTTVDDLLDFVAKTRKISRVNLCIRIQSLGMHIGYIIRGRQSEGTILKKITEGLNVKSILGGNEDDLNAVKDDENDENDKTNDVPDSSTFSSQNITASDTSAAAHTPQVWLDSENERCNDCVAPLEGEQGCKVKISEIKFCTKYTIHKTPRLWMIGIKFKPEFQSVDVETGFIDDNAIDGHTWRFIKVWKDPCDKGENVVEIFGRMLDFYNRQMKPKKKTKALNAMINSYPHVGLLNVAIASIKFGLWDRVSSFSQAISEEVAVNTCAADVNTYFMPTEKNTLVADKHVLESNVGFAFEDVLKYVKAYFVSHDDVLDNTTSYPKSK